VDIWAQAVAKAQGDVASAPEVAAVDQSE